jgi:hypothetical protein
MDDSTEPADQSQTAQEPSNEPDEIEQLRERLAFYESFDTLIQDNVSRAGALLREAAAKKSEGELALRATTEEFERTQLAERINFRKIFASLLDDVTAVQQNVERVARQVADALDDLEAVIPAAGETAGISGEQFPTMPTFSAGSAGELGSGQPPAAEHVTAEQAADLAEASGELYAQPTAEFAEPEQSRTMEPVDELVTADEAQYDPTAFTDAAQAPAPETGHVAAYDDGAIEFDAEPAQTSDLGRDIEYREGATAEFDRGPAPIDEAPFTATAEFDAGSETPFQAASGEEIENGSWEDAGSPAATTLLVHGVPRATTALSLKRYLEGLAQVHSVEPREYAEGVLRLQVSSDRPVGLEDLQGWPDAEGMVPVTVDEEFLEVRLHQ